MHNEYINIVIIRKYIEIRYVSYIIQYINFLFGILNETKTGRQKLSNTIEFRSIKDISSNMKKKNDFHLK